MIAGRMRHKLELLEPRRVVNAYGEDAVEWVATVTAYAERVKHSGQRSEEVSEHFADYRAEFNIRSAHKVGENWRVRQLGGNLYTVTNIVPNVERGFKTLICVRVNE